MLLRRSISVVPSAVRRSSSTERISEPTCFFWLRRCACSLSSSSRSIRSVVELEFGEDVIGRGRGVRWLEIGVVAIGHPTRPAAARSDRRGRPGSGSHSPTLAQPKASPDRSLRQVVLPSKPQ
jgi:hypothetical protein